MLAGLIGGGAVLAASCWVETRVADPMFEMRLFWIRPFSAGNLAGWLASVARGGLQFMLIIWLQEIWLPLHGFRFESTPLWAGIYLLPLTIAFLITGPISGYLSDRYGARAFATAGLLVVAASFLGLLLIPANFPYWLFGVFIAINGLGSGFFSSPNTTAIMNSVPANRRGVAAGMRATFFNSGTSLSIGICFSLMIVGLASTLPHTLTAGLEAHHVPAAVAQRIGDLPPVGSLFAAFLGFNPIRSLLGPCVLAHLPPADAQALVGKEFFPTLISAPFHHGLVVVFATAIVMSLVGAGASLPHGGRYPHEEATADAARGQAVQPWAGNAPVAATGSSR